MTIWGAFSVVATTVISVVADFIGTSVKDAVKDAVRAFLEKRAKEFNEPSSQAARRSSTDVESEIQDNNDQLSDLENKRRRDGNLRNRDREDIEKLWKRRQSLREEYAETRFEENLGNHTPDSFESVQVTDSNAHLPKSKVGQILRGRACPRCGRPLQLQFTNQRGGLRSLFWQCIGFYVDPLTNPTRCQHAEAYRPGTNLEYTSGGMIEEYRIPESVLEEIVAHPRAGDAIADRVRRHTGKPFADYTCPVHAERLCLREKRQFEGLMDQFFLACPRYATDGCNYLIKAKNPIQLAEWLRLSEGRGIL